MFSEETNKHLTEQSERVEQLKNSHYSSSHALMGGGIIEGVSTSHCQGDCNKHFSCLDQFCCNNCWDEPSNKEIRDFWEKVEKERDRFIFEHKYCKKGVDKQESIRNHFTEIFRENNLESVSLNNGELTINYTNGQPKKIIKKGDNSQWSWDLEDITKYLEMHQKFSLSLNELLSTINPSNTSNDSYLFSIISTIAIIATLITMLFFYLKKLKKVSKT